MCSILAILGVAMVDHPRPLGPAAVGQDRNRDRAAHGGDLLHRVPLCSEDIPLAHVGDRHYRVGHAGSRRHCHRSLPSLQRQVSRRKLIVLHAFNFKRKTKIKFFKY